VIFIKIKTNAKARFAESQHFDADLDPDPTFYFDADPNPDPSLKQGQL
jgi:hypothetical protein